ncbi:Uncharacterised protein [Mycobacteroides abscessus subsp. abscessus]|nr:Uncharacterised protein [Mycobacteroides abscessus subsp. abscessus]
MRIHGALGGTGAAGGVDEQTQGIGICTGQRRGGQVPPPRESLRQGLDDDRPAGTLKPGPHSLQRFALAVDLRVIVENREESHRGGRKHRIDGGIKVFDTRGKDCGPGLFENRVALLQRRARLQGHRDGAQTQSRDVERREVRAGETQLSDEVAVTDALLVPRGSDGLGTFPQLAVGDGGVFGLQRDHGRTVVPGDELERALAECRAVTVALQQSPDHLDQR